MNFIRFLAIINLFFSLIVGCTSNEKGNYLTKLEISIPQSLKNSSAIVEFTQESCNALNQWSITLEDLVAECSQYIGMNEEELTAEDREKLGKYMMEFVAKLGQFAVYSAEWQQQMSTLEAELTVEQLSAFEPIKNQLELRIQEIHSRYIDFGKEQEE